MPQKPGQLILQIDQATYSVTKYKTTTDGFFADHHATIHFISQNSCQATLFSSACLQMNTQTIYQGIILSINRYEYTPPFYYYQMTLRTPIALLDQTQRSRNFVKQTAVAIIKNVLQTYERIQGVFHITKPLDCLPHVCQYQETDFAFFKRLLRQQGLLAVYDDDQKTICITNDIRYFSKQTPDTHLAYQPFNTGIADPAVIFKRTQTYHLRTQHYDMIDYNPEASSKTMRQTSKTHTQLQSTGCKTVTSRNCKTTQAIRDYLQHLQVNTDAKRHVITLTSNRIGLRIGQVIIIEDAQQSHAYRIIQLTQSGEQPCILTHTDNPGHARTQTILTCIPEQQMFYHSALKRQRTLHTVTAKVATMQSQTLDHLGRYWLKFDYDPHTRTAAFRRYQRLTGRSDPKTYGMHFPIKENNTVLVGFLNDDVAQPIVLDHLPDKLHPSPVTKRNPQQAILRTESGNTVLFDEKVPLVTCYSTTPENQIYLSNEKNKLQSQKGSIALHAKQTLLIDIGKKAQYTINGNYQHHTMQAYNVFANQGNIHFQAGECLKTNIKQTQYQQANHINIHAQTTATLQANAITTQCRQGDLTCLSSNQLITQSQTQTHFYADKAITIQNTIFECNANGLFMKAKKIKINTEITKIYQASHIND